MIPLWRREEKNSERERDCDPLSALSIQSHPDDDGTNYTQPNDDAATSWNVFSLSFGN